MLRSLLSSSTGASISSSTSRVVMRASGGGAFTSTVLLLQKDVVFEEIYRGEAFRAQQRLKQSKNYPGPTRAATPGEAAYCYNGTVRLASEPSERNYWRPVVDDAPTKVLDYVTVRVQFKVNVWVSAGWEVRMHVIQVSVPRTTSLKELKSRVILDNKHPYLCQSDFQLCDADSKPLGSTPDKDGVDMTCTLEALGVQDHTVVQAVEVDEDHLLHTQARNGKFKSWHEDDLSVGELNDTSKPYRDLGYPTEPDGKPRMEAKPSALYNYGNRM
jgi:hypothetical protein